MISRRLIIPVVTGFLVAFGVGTLVYWCNFRTRAVAPRLTPQDHYDAGLKAIAENDLDSARSAIKKLETTPYFHDHARVLRATLYLQEDAPQKAADELVEPVQEEIRVTAVLVLAEAFYRLGDFVNSYAAADFAIKTEPDNPAGHRRLAALYYDLGDDPAALKELGIVAKLAPEDFRPHHLRGQIFFDAETFQGAVESFQAALDRNPPPKEKTDIVLHLAQALLKDHLYDEAAQLLDREAGDNAALLALHSEAHWAMANPQLAKQLLARAENLDPESRFVLLQKARIDVHEGRPRSAIPTLEMHLKSDPHDTESRYQLALCFRKLGNADRYQVEFSRYEETQRLRRQLADLNKQAGQEPGNAEIRDQIAELFQKLGRPRIAAAYRRAAETFRQIHK